MEKLEVRTTTKGRQPRYKQNLENVINFLRHPEDKIIIRNDEIVNIEVYENGNLIFNGDKYELYKKLKS